MRIRIAVPADAPCVESVLRESFVEYKALYTPEGFAATTPASDQILGRMKEGPLWVISLNDSIVGTVSTIHHGEELYIRGMAVLPAGRGRGTGQLLLQHIENYARARGYQRLALSTTPFLHQAIRLYERFGFRRSEQGPHDLFGTPLFTMAKNLD